MERREREGIESATSPSKETGRTSLEIFLESVSLEVITKYIEYKSGICFFLVKWPSRTKSSSSCPLGASQVS